MGGYRPEDRIRLIACGEAVPSVKFSNEEMRAETKVIQRRQIAKAIIDLYKRQLQKKSDKCEANCR